MLKKLLGYLAGGFFILVLIGLGHEYWQERQARIRAEKASEVLSVINDSTQARVSLLEVQRDSFAALVEAADKVGGDVKGGVKIVVRSDTVYLPADTAKTVITEDSARVASLSDTTEVGYQIQITAKAPPYPAPLELGYRLITPEFRPEIGFIQKGDQYLAVVSWAGQKAEIAQSFFIPEDERNLHLLAGAEMLLFTHEEDLESMQGRIYAALEYDLSDRWTSQIQLGWAGRRYIGVRFERTLW